jgi:hypothetical protein
MQIFHPAGKIMLPGYRSCFSAEKNALNPAFYYNLSAYLHSSAPQEAFSQQP